MSRNVMVPHFLLKAYGFWSFDEPDHWLYRMHRTAGIAIFVLGFSLLESLHLLGRIVEKADLTRTTDDLSHAINHMLGAYKFYVMQKEKKFVQQVYERSLRDERLSYQKNEEFETISLKLVDEKSMMLYKATGTGAIIASFFIVTGYAVPFLSGERYYAADNVTLMTSAPLPFNTWVPFAEGLLPHYYLLFAYQGISMTNVVIMIVSFDCMFYGMLLQVSTHFQILCLTVASIRQRSEGIVSATLPSAASKESKEYKSALESVLLDELRKCVVHHQIILRTSEEINARFNMTMLFQFSTTMTVFCVCLFQCLVRGLTVGLFYIIFYAMTITYELFLFCWIGKELTAKSELLPEALYSSYWSEAPARYSSSLKLFLMRSQLAVELNALGLFPLNLTTFGAIIKTGYSIFSVLQQMDYEK